MRIVLFLAAWFVSASLSRNPATGFLWAVLAAFIYRQNEKIDRLKKEVGLLTLDIKIEPPVTKSIQASLSAGLPKAEPPLQPVKNPTPEKPPEAAPEPWIAAPAPAAPPKAPVASRPAGPTAAQTIEHICGPTVAGFLLRGNPIARIGTVILFFGVAFALKLAADQGYFPIEFRLVGSATLAIIFAGLGWRLRGRTKQFSVILQGAGCGIFYLTTFIAFRLYHLIPGALTFLLLVSVTVLCGALAVLQDARTLAALGMLAGFLAPVLTSEGGGRHVLLFSYLTLLNLGIVGICYFKSWRGLNLIGFGFTFALASAWGKNYFVPEFFSSSEPFLFGFVLMYTVINVMYSLRSSGKGSGAIDSLMTFSTPLLAMLLQYGLVRRFEYGLAWSAAGFGAFYIVLTRYLFRTYQNRLRLLVEAYYSIGLGLLSLSIPFAFSGHLTSAIWAIEGAGLIWSGVRQRHQITRVFGIILIGLSALFFFIDPGFSSTAPLFFNPLFIGIVFLTAATLLAGRALVLAEEGSVTSDERAVGRFLTLLGAAWWLAGGCFEILYRRGHWIGALSAYFPNTQFDRETVAHNFYCIFLALSLVGVHFLSRRWKVSELGWLPSILIPISTLFLIDFALRSFSSGGHPLSNFGLISWPLVFGVHYFILYNLDRDSSEKRFFQHALAFWLASVILMMEPYWALQRWVPECASWSLALITIVPAAIAMLTLSQIQSQTIWPFKSRGLIYEVALLPHVAWCFFVPAFLDIWHSGDAAPLPYIPLINPLDIAQALAFILLFRMLRHTPNGERRSPEMVTTYVQALSVWGFLWITMTLLRSVHHYGGVMWNIDSLWDSSVAQAALSIFWSLLALAFMWGAHKKGVRVVWQCGAALVALVVAKLFLVDLSNQGTLARIVVFMGVGLLMLLMGYVAPIPPQRGEEQTKEE